MKGVQKEDRESARQAWEKLHPNETATEQDVSQYLYDGFYNSALEKSEMGTGGSYQRAIQATTAIVQGLSAGNISAALAGAAAPYLANQIAQHIDEKDKEARLIAHAVLGAALAAVQKQDIAAGAAGASIGELAGMIAVELKGGRAGELSEADKQTVSALATLASTLAGGLIGDSGATAVNAGLAGKNAVENNALSLPKGITETGQAAKSWVEYAQDNNLSPEQVQAGLTDIVRGDLPESANIIKAILENNPGSDTVMALFSAEDAKDYALALLTSLPAERVLALVGKAAKVIDNKILISAAEKVSTAKGLQSATPRDLNEQILWKQIESNPANGIKFSDKGLNFNTDRKFPYSAGFEKMTATHELPNGSKIEIHYQYNSVTDKAYDMKVVSPQRTQANPSDVIDSIKEKVR